MDIIAVDNLSGKQFEVFLEKLLPDLGFTEVQRTPLSGDFGGDILAKRDGKTSVIQAKRHGRALGIRSVQEVHAAKEYYHAQISMVISNRAFTVSARRLADRCNCILIDRGVLTQWLDGRFPSSADLFQYMVVEGVTNHRISNTELIRAYQSLKERLGKAVRACDMDSAGDYSSSVYRVRWGGWNKFLLEIRERPIQQKNLAEDELIPEYGRVRDLLGRTPTRSEFRRLSKYSCSAYERIWGGWSAFLESRGEHPAKRHCIPKEEFVAEFKRVRAKLGKAPTVKEMAEHANIAPTTFRRLWPGGWSSFLKEMGETYQRRNIPEEELVRAYLKLKKLLRKPSLTQRDMNEYGEFNSSVYERRWDSWAKFLEHVGDSNRKRVEVTKEELKRDYIAVCQKLGKTRCSTGDIKRHGRYSLSTYYKKFVKWKRLKEVMDEELA